MQNKKFQELKVLGILVNSIGYSALWFAKVAFRMQLVDKLEFTVLF